MGKRKRFSVGAVEEAVADDGTAVVATMSAGPLLKAAPALDTAAIEADDSTIFLFRAPADFNWSQLDGGRLPASVFHPGCTSVVARTAAGGGVALLRRLAAADDAAPQLRVLNAVDTSDETALGAATAVTVAASAAVDDDDDDEKKLASKHGRPLMLLRKRIAGTVLVGHQPAPSPSHLLLQPVQLQHRVAVAPPAAPRSTTVGASKRQRARTGSKASRAR